MFGKLNKTLFGKRRVKCLFFFLKPCQSVSLYKTLKHKQSTDHNELLLIILRNNSIKYYLTINTVIQKITIIKIFKKLYFVF